MDIRDVRVRKTYSQLLQGTIKLLSEKSFDDISVSEICKVSNVHRATFYKHFNDKFEFLNVCIKNQLNSITFDPLEKGSSPQVIKERIMHFAISIIEFIDNNRSLFFFISRDTGSITFNAALDSAFYDFCFKRLNEVLSASSQRISLCSAYYSSAFIGIIKWYFRAENVNSKEDMLDFVEHRVDELCDFYVKNLIVND